MITSKYEQTLATIIQYKVKVTNIATDLEWYEIFYSPLHLFPFMRIITISVANTSTCKINISGNKPNQNNRERYFLSYYNCMQLRNATNEINPFIDTRAYLTLYVSSKHFILEKWVSLAINDIILYLYLKG